LVGHPNDRGKDCTFRTFYFFPFSFYFLSFYFWQQLIFWCLFLWDNISISFWQVFWCLNLGDALTFFTPWCILTLGNVFLYYTLKAMCNSSLGVWKNTLSVCLFVCLFICLFVLENVKEKFFNIVDWAWLYRNCGLYVIGSFNILNTARR
jgi:hypothetical protein